MLTFPEIEQRRAAAGLTQKALAERAGIKPQTYHKLKRPTPRGPTSLTLEKLTAALDALIEEGSDGRV